MHILLEIILLQTIFSTADNKQLKNKAKASEKSGAYKK
jgi:hypothetical protein